MGKKRTSLQSLLPLPDMAEPAGDILKEFNEAVRALADTKNALERDVTNLRDELEKIQRERVVLEADFGKTNDISEIAMAAKAAEEEKQDVLMRNQELKSYLDSAADTIKGFEIRLAEGDNEIKRLRRRVESFEQEKSILFKEREDLKAKAIRMNDMIREQDLKIKDLTIKSETQEDDKRYLESELESTKKTLNEIQESMVSIKDKMTRGQFNRS
ncbi:MAG: hypothetical protein V3S04_04430 [Candidatus Omnitrophota bacterium]